MNDRSIIVYANGLGWVSSFPTTCSSWPCLNLKTVSFGVCWQSQESIFRRLVKHRKGPQAWNWIIWISPYWTYSLAVLSSTDEEALLDSYFLLTEANAGETNEQGFRYEGSWVLFPVQPRALNKTWGSKPDTLPSNLKPEGAITQRTLEPFWRPCLFPFCFGRGQLLIPNL